MTERERPDQSDRQTETHTTDSPDSPSQAPLPKTVGEYRILSKQSETGA